ncbi:tRNA (adenine-N1)-methyltransferase [Candidatus Bipolaricaulota bacterium]|nr:tRNA (adenine-N1)-methyltransferase [Candidatus Bipolaricaulota bacterium]
MAKPLEYGEDVLLMEVGKDRTFLVRLEQGQALHTHRGTIAHDAVAGQPEGTTILTHTGHRFLAFRPRIGERMFKVRRRTQIVYPKDAGWLILALDVRPGMRVLEMGTGSGAFTILLAQLVGPEGRVYTFDRREEFLENALANIARAGLASRVEAQVLTAGAPFPVSDVDAAFLDLPGPWEAIPATYGALAPGRPLALIVPTAEQLKEAVRVLTETGFAAVEVVELLERRVLVRQREGVRPSERMIGFTGYLVSARKCVSPQGLLSQDAPGVEP